ncbi:serine/threonine protein phosphatase [Ruegeria sp. R8_2]|nr:serine/threonine protein phosphatase [Ruegeria sp. R8_1]MBO9415530.1 serine/threonine protein phosphatase [Ruegeria sp. R8_2]
MPNLHLFGLCGPLQTLTSLIGRFRRAEFATPMPAEPICVIGDVHGCISQLEHLLAKVPDDHRLVLVGDYIDRGEHSAEVLKLLSARTDITCLMGNHEEMLLRFLQDPKRHGPRWLRYGGLQTLASFGISGVRPEMSGDDLQASRDRLQFAMGQPLCSWLAALHNRFLTGTVLVTHAGADPNRALDEQSDKALIWGHPDFDKKDRRDGMWVVHGHTIVPKAKAERGRIAIDTGAFATGQLSAVCLDGTEPRFLES